MSRWTTSEDRLASRADLAARTVLRGPLQPQLGKTYVASLDVGVSNDRSVLAVMHEQTLADRERVLGPDPRHPGLAEQPRQRLPGDGPD